MSEKANYVELTGVLSRDPKHGRGKITSWCFATVRPNGSKSYIGIKAFGDTADALSVMKEGDALSVHGHLESERPKDGGGQWSLVVVADQVFAAESIPF